MNKEKKIQKIAKKAIAILKKKYNDKEINEILKDKRKTNTVLNKTLLEIQTLETIRESQKKFKNKNEKIKFIIETKIQENKNRKYFLKEDGAPNYMTGLNVLEDVMKTIRPIIINQYKMLTTSKTQRYSFKIHLLNGIVNMFQGFFLTGAQKPNIKNFTVKPVKDLKDKNSNFSPEEGKTIKTGEDQNKIISIDKKQDVDKIRFTIPDQDLTGANFAYDVFKKIKPKILDAFEKLSLKEDQEVFYRYLLANLVVEMKTAEEELRADLPDERINAIKKELPQNYKINSEQESEEPEAEVGGENETAAPEEETIDTQEENKHTDETPKEKAPPKASSSPETEEEDYI